MRQSVLVRVKTNDDAVEQGKAKIGMKRSGDGVYERLMRDGTKRQGAGTPKRTRKGADAAREEEPLRPRSGPEEGGDEGRKENMEMDCLAVRFTTTNQPIFMLKGGKY